jgi:hypothetical protein
MSANLKIPKLINNNNNKIRQIQYKFINQNTTNINETTLSTIRNTSTQILPENKYIKCAETKYMKLLSETSTQILSETKYMKLKVKHKHQVR